MKKATLFLAIIISAHFDITSSAKLKHPRSPIRPEEIRDDRLLSILGDRSYERRQKKLIAIPKSASSLSISEVVHNTPVIENKMKKGAFVKFCSELWNGKNQNLEPIVQDMKNGFEFLSNVQKRYVPDSNKDVIFHLFAYADLEWQGFETILKVLRYSSKRCSEEIEARFREILNQFNIFNNNIAFFVKKSQHVLMKWEQIEFHDDLEDLCFKWKEFSKVFMTFSDDN